MRVVREGLRQNLKDHGEKGRYHGEGHCKIEQVEYDFRERKKAAKELGATVKTSELVSPTGQVPDIGSMQSGQANLAFTMKPGDVSAPIQNGNTGVVLRILEKQEPSAAEFAKAKDQTRDKVADEKRGELFELFVTNLRQDMEKRGKIRVNEQVMKQLSTPRGELGG